MKPSSALLLYNAPLLGEETSAEALAERGVLEAVEAVGAVLEGRGWSVRRWALSPVNVSLFLEEIEGAPPEVVVNLFEGFPGVDDQEARVAALLDGLAVPYTGSGPEVLELCRRKELCGQRLRDSGLATPAEWVVSDGLADLPEGPLPWPVIVKPAWEDGSVGISRASVASTRPDLERHLARVRANGEVGPLLVQEYLDGREFAVSLLGAGPVEALALSEMDFSGLPAGYPPIVTDEAKWCEASEAYRGVVPRCPADIEHSVEEELRRAATRAAEVLGLRDYARVDMRLKDGRPVVIDVNPNPDLAPNAGFARSAQAAGVAYDELVALLVEYALQRR